MKKVKCISCFELVHDLGSNSYNCNNTFLKRFNSSQNLSIRQIRAGRYCRYYLPKNNLKGGD